MRLWSLHPKYLDTKGLVSLWRESLLAKSVLEGKTNGYTNHPQLIRFKKHAYPIPAINSYLSSIYLEAKSRGFKFNQDKFQLLTTALDKIPVTDGQIEYEHIHLLKKLNTRDINSYQKLKTVKVFDAHPLFKVIKGEIADWEITASKNKEYNT